MPRRPAHKRKRDAMEDDGNKTRIRTTSVRKVTATGKIMTASVGKVTVASGNMSTRGGKATAKGWDYDGKWGNVSVRGGKVTSTPSTPSTPPPGFEMSTSDTAIRAVRTSGGAIKLKEVSSKGRGDGSKSRMYPFSIRPIGFGMSWDPIDGQTMLGSSMGLPRHAWPEGITPQDCIIHAATQSEIALSHSQLVMFNKPPAPGPGLDPDDAISIE
ncbi:hypothetical protein Tco_0665445 [Tanacetum coccineum]